ncbi:50S ribosomal protein L23 [Candidatus Uhrbacteria bacterium]|nr:50S ribosomal protein L23 [Candidatus Uhrbacteria bacterium]
MHEKKSTAGTIRVGSLLLRPLVTEKGTRQNTQNQYAFVVAPTTNKIEVRQAVEAVYNIRPIKVNMLRVQGKKIRYGRTMGVTKAWKKAIVTLPKGKTIQIYEGV